MAIVGHSIERAASLLRAGYPVAIPTETVYGLAANACNPDALLKVFEAKKRPLFDPLIVHLPSVEAILPYAQEIPPLAYDLWAKYSPGPLTLVLRKSSLLPDLVSSGLPTAGFRIPSHPIALTLLWEVDFPLAAPSANLFGRVSPTSADHVMNQLGDAIPYVLDGGPCHVGLESTILDLSGEVPLLLREGGIPSQQIEHDFQFTLRRPSHSFRVSDGYAQAPGTLENHYAPAVPLKLVHHHESLDSVLAQILSPGNNGHPISPAVNFPRNTALGLLLFQTDISEAHRQQWEGQFKGLALHVEVLSQAGNLQEAARNLFAALRNLERVSDYILAQSVPETGLGLAINDRLRRASWVSSSK